MTHWQAGALTLVDAAGSSDDEQEEITDKLCSAGVCTAVYESVKCTGSCVRNDVHWIGRKREISDVGRARREPNKHGPSVFFIASEDLIEHRTLTEPSGSAAVIKAQFRSIFYSASL